MGKKCFIHATSVTLHGGHMVLRVCLNTAYFIETENLLLKVL